MMFFVPVVPLLFYSFFIFLKKSFSHTKTCSYRPKVIITTTRIDDFCKFVKTTLLLFWVMATFVDENKLDLKAMVE